MGHRRVPSTEDKNGQMGATTHSPATAARTLQDQSHQDWYWFSLIHKAINCTCSEATSSPTGMRVV